MAKAAEAMVAARAAARAEAAAREAAAVAVVRVEGRAVLRLRVASGGS